MFAACVCYVQCSKEIGSNNTAMYFLITFSPDALEEHCKHSLLRLITYEHPYMKNRWFSQLAFCELSEAAEKNASTIQK